MKTVFVPLLVAVIALQGCNQEKPAAEEAEATEQTQATNLNETTTLKVSEPNDSSTAIISGTVEFKPMEGGFYAIIGDDGSHFLPLNLSDEHKRHGLKVEVTAEVKRNVLTIYNFGTPIHITEITVIDESGVHKPGEM